VAIPEVKEATCSNTASKPQSWAGESHDKLSSLSE